MSSHHPRIVAMTVLAPAAGAFFLLSGCLWGGELIPPADPVASNYMLKCAGCHTVGRGKLTGPDLKDSAFWPEKDLLPKIKLMEKQVGPLDAREIASFAQFLKDPKVQERILAEEARMAKADEAKYEKGSEKKGKELFMGWVPFKKGGPACVACHTAGTWGGNFGPDLSRTFVKMGETALVSACEKTQFKVMDAAYRAHPVTRQEAIHLTRFLEVASQGKSPRDRAPEAVNGSALILCAVSLGGIALYYRRNEPGRGQRSKRG